MRRRGAAYIRSVWFNRCLDKTSSKAPEETRVERGDARGPEPGHDVHADGVPGVPELRRGVRRGVGRERRARACEVENHG